jgi:ABC-type glutathione transport system ATPase component
LGVVGPSGVGKSSFVRAGVVPALKHSGEPWTAIVIRPGRQPVDALAQVASSMIRRTTSTVAGDLSEHRAMVERLYQEPGYLGTALRSRARRKQINILVFVDQFEEFCSA